MTRVVGLLLLLVAGSVALAAAPDSAGFMDTAPKVVAVTGRDSSGRALHFTDAGNREFVIKYDEQRRVKSVEATFKPHISDIVSIGYAPDGKVVGVKFRTGYMVFFDNQPNGTQVIRDSDGGAVRRAGRAVTPVVDAPAEQSARLATSVTEFESLMTALGQLSR